MKTQKYVNHGTQLAEYAGKLVAEKLAVEDKTGSFKERLSENFKINFSESGQTTSNNAGAFTTLLGDVLSKAAVKEIGHIMKLVYHDRRLVNTKGHGAVQLPRQTPTIAFEVAEGAVAQKFTEGIDSITVTPKKVVAATNMTWELRNRGMEGLSGYIMQGAKEAVSRKIGSDIVNGLVAGSDHTALTGGASYDNIVLGIEAIQNATYANGVNYGYQPDYLVLNPTGFRKLRQDADIKQYLYRGTPFPQAVGTDTPLMLDNLEIVDTPLLTSAEGLIGVKEKNIMVWESEGETFEGHIPGRLQDREIIFLASYVLGVVQPLAQIAITA